MNDVTAKSLPIVWRGIDQVPHDLSGSSVAVGVFDGVHNGHRTLISKARAISGGDPVVAVTFDPHPMSVVRPGHEPAMLSTLEHRIALLGEAGADAVLIIDFTRELSQYTPEEFIDQVISGRLHAHHVVVGDNFRFGHRAAGDVTTLTELGESRGFEVIGVGLVGEVGEAWSSTYVRGLITAGDVGAAAHILSRPHRVEGIIVTGDQRGRTIGFPTANLQPGNHAALPGDGVYAGTLTVDPYGDPVTMPAAISVGTNPQFTAGSHEPPRRVESFVIDAQAYADRFGGEGGTIDLYGRAVAVDFVARIRGQWTFPTLEDLIARIEDDVRAARSALSA